MPSIEVDEQVMAYLRTRVKDFNEDPNTVIKRELGLTSEKPTLGLAAQYDAVAAEKSRGDFQYMHYVVASRTKALRQILAVVWHVRGEFMDRNAATQRVAEKYRVARETVQDKYARQLGLTTEEFDELLAEKSLGKLQTKLIAKFPEDEEGIVKVLSAFSASPTRR